MTLRAQHPRQCPQLGELRTGQRRPDRARADLGLDLGGGTVGDDPTSGEEHDPVGVGIGLLEVVGGEDDRLAPLRHRPQGPPEVPAALDVDPRRRLVEDQQVRVADKRGGKAHPLGLTTRELAGPASCDVRRTGLAQHFFDRKRLRVVRRHQPDQLAHPELVGW